MGNKISLSILTLAVTICTSIETAQSGKPLQEEPGRKYSAEQQALIKKLNSAYCNGMGSPCEHSKKRPFQDAILKHGIHPDDVGERCPLLSHALIYHQDVSFIRFLLAHGADPNRFDYEGTRPLHYARDYARATEKTIAVICHGANVGYRDGSGYTLLHLLGAHTSKDDAELALLYCMGGADPCAVDRFGETALAKVANAVACGVGADRLKNCLALAAMLVRIGVPFESLINDQEKWGARVDPRISRDMKCLKELLEKEGKEVVGWNARFHAALHRTLLSATPLPEVLCPLVADYAKEHVLPPSAVPDLKKLRKELVIFEQQYAAEHWGP